MDDDGVEKASSYSSGFARDYAFPPLDGISSNLSDGMFAGAIRGQMVCFDSRFRRFPLTFQSRSYCFHSCCFPLVFT